MHAHGLTQLPVVFHQLVGIVGMISEVQALKLDLLHSVIAALPSEVHLMEQGFHNLDRLLATSQHQVPSLRCVLGPASPSGGTDSTPPP